MWAKSVEFAEVWNPGIKTVHRVWIYSCSHSKGQEQDDLEDEAGLAYLTEALIHAGMFLVLLSLKHTFSDITVV